MVEAERTSPIFEHRRIARTKKGGASAAFLFPP
jgi:hypothetical protein